MFVVEGWRDYELMDAGNGMKLERWGQYITARPEPRAIWNKLYPQLWAKADATHTNEGWKFRNLPPVNWQISYQLETNAKIFFSLKPTNFKHTGVFPEQALNWKWVYEKVKAAKIAGRQTRVLNLFAYTGGASIAAAAAGAKVTHVDAAKPALMWASENAKLSSVGRESIRWIQDDALKFAKRETRRGIKYEAIIMDPPRFGRGKGGEVWKLEEKLPELAVECAKLLAEYPLFVLINAYTADLSHWAIRYTLEDALGDKLRTGQIESGEVGVRIGNSERSLPAGVFTKGWWD